jgi:hypothetical protein
MRALREVAVSLIATALACSFAEQVDAKDACMLQHGTTGMRATVELREELEHAKSKQAPLRAAKSAKLAPHSHPILTRLGPRPGGKSAPRASGKSPNDDRTTVAPKTFSKSPPTTTTTTTSTTAVIPDFGDDETVSKNVELSIKPSLEEINLGPTGPLDAFSETFKVDILSAMAITDPERMTGLRMNDKAENEGARLLIQVMPHRKKGGSQIDFEVTAGSPSAGRSVGNLAAQMADKRSELMTGSLRQILKGAVMVVTNGSQSSNPVLTWKENQTPEQSSIIKQIETTLGVPWAVIVLCLAVVAIAAAYYARSRLN